MVLIYNSSPSNRKSTDDGKTLIQVEILKAIFNTERCGQDNITKHSSTRSQVAARAI